MKMMWLYLVLVVGTISVNAVASDELSTAQIRALVKQGEILSLEVIKQRHQALMQGKLLDLEVENEQGRILYEMDFLRENGDVMELKIDARSGEILKQEIER